MNEKAADAYLSEFESLREELFARFESQRQAFNYLMAFFAALIALLATEHTLQIDLRYSLLIPLVTCPLCFIFYDNEIVIWCIGSYIDKELRPLLSKSVEAEVLQLEARRGGHLSGPTEKLHLLLSVGRWILFFTPAMVPPAIALSAGWLSGSFFFALVFGIDLLLLAILIGAAFTVTRMRLKAWKSSTPSTK